MFDSPIAVGITGLRALSINEITLLLVFILLLILVIFLLRMR